MFLVMAKDLRVVLVKLADRMHNLRTLSALPEVKQKRIAKESLEIYAPLAERLGIGEIKGQIEDLAFPFVYPKEYEKIQQLSKKYFKKVNECIKDMRHAILKECAEHNLRPKIQTRRN